MVSSTVMRVQGRRSRSARRGGRSDRTESTSACSRASTSGWRSSAWRVQTSAVAVVSWPAMNMVMTSSRSWRSVMRSPVSSSSASMNMLSRSPRSRGSARRSAMSRFTVRSMTRTAARTRRSGRRGSHSGTPMKSRNRSRWRSSARMASPTRRASSSSRPSENIAWAMIFMVTRDISDCMSSAAPEAAAGCHPRCMSSASSAIASAKPAIRLRWNAGAAMRRWRRQNAPSLVSRPRPRSGSSSARAMGVLRYRPARVTRTWRTICGWTAVATRANSRRRTRNPPLPTWR